MRMTSLKCILGALVCVATLLSVNSAKAQKPTLKHIVSNLENPSGVAVQPKTGHVFVATRYGIYRYVPKDKKVYLEIDSFPTDVYGKGTFETHTKFNVGPLGLAFLNDDHLIVGDGSRKDGAELVRVYKIPAKPVVSDDGRKEDSAAYTLGPIKAGEKTVKGEGNFFGVAVGAGGIYVTCNGDDTKGWISKALIKDGKPGKLEPSIASKVATGVDAPAPITFSLDGKELLVGQMGEMNVPGDSLLTVYDPKTGKLKKKYATGMSDLVGLAFSPKTKKLYATDFGWADASKKKAAEKVGGLYELTIKGDKVEKKKILALDKPAAITFTADGKLYITLFGSKDAKDKSDSSPGGLYVIEAGL
jgi:DNA-binding beta-propeller fold protein YncE